MVVRISKPAFNLREKLSELDIPVGAHGSQVMKSADAAESFELVRAGRKNKIINGAMSINQSHHTSSATAGSGTYMCDRWCVHEATGGAASVNMDGDPLNHPQTCEFSKCMQVACSTADDSLGNSENIHIWQAIEGHNITSLAWGTRYAKTVTLSFWVKTNKEGIYCVGLENNATDRCCIREYYHDGSHRWKKYALTFPGCTNGTWQVGTNIGIRVRFCLASGTDFDDGADGFWVTTDELHTGNQVNFMDSTNNRFMITGVQLEEGPIATPFEHRSIGEELALCQRYYEGIYMTDGTAAFRSYAAQGGGANMEYQYAVTKRVKPSFSIEGNASWTGDTPNAFESKSNLLLQVNDGTAFSLGDADGDLCASINANGG